MSSATCTHSDELLTLGALGLLSTAERASLEAQVSACDACRQRWRDYQALAGAMPQLVRLETAPSQEVNAQPVISPNGKAPHTPAFFEAGTEPTPGHLTSPQRPSVSTLQRRYAHRRLVRVLSGLAAAILLLGVVGSFWLLLLSHNSRSSHPTVTPQPTKTVTLYNPCPNDIAKGAPGAPPACGVVVMDYSQTPPLLEELNPTTGKPLGIRPPLLVGNALLAALSADHLTLALGVLPDQNTSATSIQMIWLDTWEVGAKLQLTLSEGESLQDLAVTPDGSGIYAVIDDSTQTPTRGTLQYFAVDRAHERLTLRWSAPLPFVPGNGTINDRSFSLSADGKTAYIFSAATNPPQLAAFPLRTNGIGSPRTLNLPSIASGAPPPVGDENYIYKPGDPIYQSYQPAVMFVPEQNKLYLVHAEAQDPNKDVLVVIDLANMTLGPDIPIFGEGLPVPPSSPTSSDAAANRALLTMQPQRGMRPFKGKPYYGRSEVGVVSSDGRWIYLSGTSYVPVFNSDGNWSGEQSVGMGVLQIDTKYGQVVEDGYAQISFSALTLGQDGRNLYLYGPIPDPSSNIIDPNGTPVLLVFDTQQHKVVSSFTNIQGGWFILPLPSP